MKEIEKIDSEILAIAIFLLTLVLSGAINAILGG